MKNERERKARPAESKGDFQLRWIKSWGWRVNKAENCPLSRSLLCLLHNMTQQCDGAEQRQEQWLKFISTLTRGRKSAHISHWNSTCSILVLKVQVLQAKSQSNSFELYFYELILRCADWTSLSYYSLLFFLTHKTLVIVFLNFPKWSKHYR